MHALIGGTSAESPAAARRIAALTGKHRLVVEAEYEQRHSPVWETARDMLRAGRLGMLVAIRSIALWNGDISTMVLFTRRKRWYATDPHDLLLHQSGPLAGRRPAVRLCVRELKAPYRPGLDNRGDLRSKHPLPRGSPLQHDRRFRLITRTSGIVSDVCRHGSLAGTGPSQKRHRHIDYIRRKEQLPEQTFRHSRRSADGRGHFEVYRQAPRC